MPNGSDPAMFAVDDDRDTLRQRYGMTGFAVVYAGAHGPANGLGLVLDAAEQLQNDAPDVEFVLVGDGVDKEALVAEAAQSGLTNVRFLDPIPKSEMPGLLAAADAGLHVLADVPLFRYGVSPNKLFDYMAAGLPVVTNCPGEVEAIVTSAEAGIAVEPDEIDVAVRKIRRGVERSAGGVGASRTGLHRGAPVARGCVRPAWCRSRQGREPVMAGQRANLGVKRVVDLVGAATAGVLLLPVLAGAALAIRTRIGPPVIFRQPRPGLEGDLFTLYKLRTMTDQVGADGTDPPRR